MHTANSVGELADLPLSDLFELCEGMNQELEEMARFAGERMGADR